MNVSNSVSVNSQAIVTKCCSLYPENFAKLHLAFQKLDHLTCNAILRINRNEVDGFIHVIEERHR